MNTPEMTSNESEQNEQPLASPRTEPRRYPEPGETYYYIHDHNENVVALTDKDANIVARYIYDPFGNIIHSNGEMVEANPFRFASEFHNRDTGLIDYLYRSYNPKDGRWTQRDPIAEQGGLNLYNFVENDPMNQIDLLGESSKSGLQHEGIRVDYELNKGDNTSNVHIQIKGRGGRDEDNKFIFRKDKKNPGFYNGRGQQLPKDVRKMLKNPNGQLSKDLRKAIKAVNDNGGISTKYGGGRIPSTFALFFFFVGLANECSCYAEAYMEGDIKKMDRAYNDLLENSPDTGTIMRGALWEETRDTHHQLKIEANKNRK